VHAGYFRFAKNLRRPYYVLRQAFLSGLVEYADAVVNAETGMLPGQKVPGKVFIQQFAFYEQSDHPTPEYLDHRL
jgi:hypothetical protein